MVLSGIGAGVFAADSMNSFRVWVGSEMLQVMLLQVNEARTEGLSGSGSSVGIHTYKNIKGILCEGPFITINYKSIKVILCGVPFVWWIGSSLILQCRDISNILVVSVKYVFMVLRSSTSLPLHSAKSIEPIFCCLLN